MAAGVEWIQEHIEYAREPADYWQASGETLGRGAGDCEDRAILLYVYAIQAGIVPEDLDLILMERTRPDGSMAYHVAVVLYGEADPDFMTPVAMRVYSIEGMVVGEYRIMAIFNPERIDILTPKWVMTPRHGGA
jgi:hypothetical protein